MKRGMKIFYSVLVMMLVVTIYSAFALAATYVQFIPNPVQAGNNLTINITPSTGGIYNYVYIYTETNIYKTYLKLPCPSYNNSYNCTSPVLTIFTIPKTWVSGRYYLWVYDFSGANYTQRIKKFYFNITGGAQPRNLSVRLSPLAVQAGKNLTINITPGTEGIYRGIFFYNSTTYKTYTYLPCGSYICYNPIISIFNVPISWNVGNYSVRIYDYGELNYTKKWKKFDFFVYI